MAKGAYVGVDGKAKRVKEIYLGKEVEVPIYAPDKTVSVTESNVAEYFDVVNESYSFVGRNGVWTSNNKGVTHSRATTTFIAKADFWAISFSYTVSSEQGDKLVLTVAGAIVEDSLSGPTVPTKSWSGAMKKGDKIWLVFKKDGYLGNSYDDCATFSNLSVTTQTLEGHQKKSVAKTVKKGYVGVGGVARPFWTGGEVSYYGAIAPLTDPKHSIAAATIGDYALFAGGGGIDASYQGGVTHATVDTYNRNLIRGTAHNLCEAKDVVAAATVGDYALFAGGGVSTVVDAYNRALTHSTPAGLLSWTIDISAASVGDYALFAYWGRSPEGYFLNAYSGTLTRTTPAADNIGGRRASATVGDYAVFAHVDSKGTVIAYSKTLTRVTLTPLPEQRLYPAATTIGDYALFAGGQNQFNYPKDDVYAYDRTLTRSTPSGLSVARCHLAATAVGDYAVFAGGHQHNKGERPEVDAYNRSLIRSKPRDLPAAKYQLAATTIGDYALFAGGHTWSPDVPYETVDVYTI